MLTPCQAEALRAIEENRYVFLSGYAGTGKSYVIKGLPFTLCGASGKCAADLGGVTIHSFTGVKFGGHIVPTVISMKHKSEIKQVHDLVIDEISMIDGRMMDLLDLYFRCVRGSLLPFGGMRVVFCGDPFQIGPVQRRGGWFFESEVWKRMKPKFIFMKTPCRQQGEFSRILNIMRWGRGGGEVEDYMRSRVSSDVSDCKVMCNTNEEVEMWNRKLFNGSVCDVVFTKNGKDRNRKAYFNGQVCEWREGRVGTYTGDLPLRMCMGMTVHRAQGSTFDRVSVGLKRCFAPGQAYVACSRGKDLRVREYNSRAVFAERKVVEFLNGHGLYAA